MSKMNLSYNKLVNDPIDRLCQARNNIISVNQYLQEIQGSSQELIQLLYDSEEQLNLLQRWFIVNHEFIMDGIMELENE